MIEPDPKTEHDLEWPRVCEAVAARRRVRTEDAAELPLAATPEAARRALAETSEAAALLAAGEPLPLDGIRDVGHALLRLSREGDLDGPSLWDVCVTLGAARVLRKYLHRRREQLPFLFQACPFDPSLDGLEEILSDALEPDGTLADRASDELRRLRGEVAQLRARLTAKLEEMVHRRADILSDAFFTVRDGRYVLPVRRDAHERIPGIVHGTSGSGATVFVEPRALVVQGNRLTMAQAELAREEARILGILSGEVRERLPSVLAAVDSLLHADLRNASGLLGRDLGARVLPLLDVAELRLARARHPLLALDGVAVVPNDLALREGTALVLSGPNAGGKTVALKTMGLVALMMRAGLPVPADEGSACGFFAPILTDVGDDQSLTKNLSTFSAHVTNLARILGEAGRGSLVLLDELAGGTDPEEGAALACAVVDTLCRQGAATAVTTHYEPLKGLAAQDPRMRNAAVGFDVARLAPTFELHLDVPGASSALDIAARFGIPHAVIDVARRILPEQARTFDELVRKLDAQRRELAVEAAGLREARLAVEAEKRSIEEQLAALRAIGKRKLDAESERLLAGVRQARGELKEARRALRDARDEAALLAVGTRLESANRVAAEARSSLRGASEAAADGGLQESDVHVGDRVYVGHLKSEAAVIEGPTRGKVRVAAGPVKLWVALGDLHRPSDASRAAGSSAQPKLAPAEGAPRRVERTVDNTLDLRGLRADEAVAMAESFLDRLYGDAQSAAFLVHGVGSGALRAAVREMLGREARYVASFRPGTADEGGEAVTVVELR